MHIFIRRHIHAAAGFTLAILVLCCIVAIAG